MQAYSDPRRESDPIALPDLEIFRVPLDYDLGQEDGQPMEPGIYWWACCPGCLPDGEAIGPFETADLAIADARNLD